MTDAADLQPALLAAARRVLPHFAPPELSANDASSASGSLTISRIPGGCIHDSFVVTPPTGPRYFLQRINQSVFPDPAALMSNIMRVTEHLRTRMEATPGADLDRGALRVIPARDGRPLVEMDDSIGAWRLFRFVERARVLTAVRTSEDAANIGRAYGAFQRLLATEFPWPPLIELIPDFHDTPLCLEALELAATRDPLGRARDARPDIDAILRYPRYADYIIERRRRHILPDRVVHNDCKPGNVLLDEQTGRPLCVVDLDTVTTGTVLCDFGDMIRSIVSTVAEDEPNAGLVDIRMDLFAGLARGYLAEAGSFLTAGERAGLVMAGLAITLEQAARFMTDYLTGDNYYKSTRPRQNLDRARTQITLFLRLLASRDVMERIIGNAE